jgi:hypothetical protein
VHSGEPHPEYLHTTTENTASSDGWSWQLRFDTVKKLWTQGPAEFNLLSDATRLFGSHPDAKAPGARKLIFRSGTIYKEAIAKYPPTAKLGVHT